MTARSVTCDANSSQSTDDHIAESSTLPDWSRESPGEPTSSSSEVRDRNAFWLASTSAMVSRNVAFCFFRRLSHTVIPLHYSVAKEEKTPEALWLASTSAVVSRKRHLQLLPLPAHHTRNGN